jgi:hypothetical protein
MFEYSAKENVPGTVVNVTGAPARRSQFEEKEHIMPNSVWDSEVHITLDQAHKPEARLVYVGNRTVEVLTPFPSPIDW